MYHGLIPVFNIPYLNVDPSPESRLAQVKDVMNVNPIIVPKLIHMSKLEELLKKCNEADEDKTRGIKHHGAPFFYLEKYEDDYDPHVEFKLGEEVWWENTQDGRQEVTIVQLKERRSSNSKVIESTHPLRLPNNSHFHYVINLEGTEHTVAHKALRKQKGCTHHAFPVVSGIKEDAIGNRTGVLEGMISRDELLYALVAAKNGDHTLHFVHLMKFCDRSPLTVYPNTRLSRAYSVFQKLGMRHLPVVNEIGLVQGMITRKNLMHYLLTDQKEQELIKVRNVQRGARRFLARRRAQSDTYFKKYTDSTTMGMDAYKLAISKFKLTNDVLPDPMENDQLEDCLTFIDAEPLFNLTNSITLLEFRICLAKARQWRLAQLNKQSTVVGDIHEDVINALSEQ